MEKGNYKKFKIALALNETTLTSFAKRYKVSEVAIIRTAQGKTKSKRLSTIIDKYITKNIPKGLM